MERNCLTTRGSRPRSRPSRLEDHRSSDGKGGRSVSDGRTRTQSRPTGKDSPRTRRCRAVLDLDRPRRRSAACHATRCCLADDAIYFATGPGEQKAVNLRTNQNVILNDRLQRVGPRARRRGRGRGRPGDGRECPPTPRRDVGDEVGRRWRYKVHDRGFRHEGGSGSVLVFSVKPAKVLAFAKGTYGQTRHGFSVPARRT